MNRNYISNLELLENEVIIGHNLWDETRLNYPDWNFDGVQAMEIELPDVAEIRNVLFGCSDYNDFIKATDALRDVNSPMLLTLKKNRSVCDEACEELNRGCTHDYYSRKLPDCNSTHCFELRIATQVNDETRRIIARKHRLVVIPSTETLEVEPDTAKYKVVYYSVMINGELIHEVDLIGYEFIIDKTDVKNLCWERTKHGKIETSGSNRERLSVYTAIKHAGIRKNGCTDGNIGQKRAMDWQTCQPRGYYQNRYTARSYVQSPRGDVGVLRYA